MFENMTYENILNDMLSRVTSDVDKREGSVFMMHLLHVHINWHKRTSI